VPHPAGAAERAGEPLPLAERERQIAVARERALHSTTAKPRLDRILGGETAGPSASPENK